ncbi:DUF6894 family protein [Methylobacterium iners]|uniref:DUF6894 domain-containing protein n=1 Tax=Methylobacterium iners TaxID=418707 RepID=A0ABQ4S338_9HYPH|nr:hypothetical protein [Methylobacterium iners]GJD96105.1 hypothetical protein OCOJLMKI_3323 [Methylobacterium iners]
MARYFFDVHNSTLMRDTEGSECAGFEEIRREAMLMLPAFAKDKIPKDGDRQAFTMLVRNEAHVTVYTATLTFAGLWLGEDVPPIDEPSD